MYTGRRKEKRRKPPAGFSLVELVAVMIILAILSGGVAVGVKTMMDKSRMRATVTQIANLEQALQVFEMECGFYPAALEGLISEGAAGRPCRDFPQGGFLSKGKLPEDPWKSSYQYTSPGVRNPGKYDLWSNGPDGEEGTSDDITNWAEELE